MAYFKVERVQNSISFDVFTVMQITKFHVWTKIITCAVFKLLSSGVRKSLNDLSGLNRFREILCAIKKAQQVLNGKLHTDEPTYTTHTPVRAHFVMHELFRRR